MQFDVTVFVVDDDIGVRNSLRRLFRHAGLNVETYASAEEFLDAYNVNIPGCLLLDVNMPGMNGLDLQIILVERRIRIPVIILSGAGNVPIVVRAMKAGALDFIEKPSESEVLLDRVSKAISLDAQARRDQLQCAEIELRLARLTPRERAVMDMLIVGKANKMIGYELGISSRTVEIHRARLMQKMQVDSVPELVQVALTFGASHQVCV